MKNANNTMKQFLVMVFCTSLFYTVACSENSGATPEFKDFAVTETFKGTPQEVDLQSHPNAMEYKTALQTGAKKGPNFAGQYTIVTIGCGASCQTNWIISADTGKILADFGSEYGVKFELNSRLIIANPVSDLAKEEIPSWLKVSYYEFKNDKLKLIKSFAPNEQKENEKKE